ncbi:MAG: UrcA family protein [Proteobacteria bacterium]|nr:UrcA family protein [Pseudomonadota bacterium]
MNTFKSICTSFVPAAVVTLGLAAAAHADNETLSVRVNYSDLNLSSSAGASKLYQRITAAAREVCPYDSRSMAQYEHAKACKRQAIDEAVAKVNSPLLTAVHNGARDTTRTAMLIR